MIQISFYPNDQTHIVYRIAKLPKPNIDRWVGKPSFTVYQGPWFMGNTWFPYPVIDLVYIETILKQIVNQKFRILTNL